MRSLIWQGKDLIEPVSGRIYPESDGIIDLVAEEERYSDLGDSSHYERFPYEFVDWSNTNIETVDSPEEPMEGKS